VILLNALSKITQWSEQMKKRPVFKTLLSRISEPRHLMQVLLGPRQVGKTTLALQAAEESDKPHHPINGKETQAFRPGRNCRSLF
jgi:predicted AAA+ superfamily ATPase